MYKYYNKNFQLHFRYVINNSGNVISGYDLIDYFEKEIRPANIIICDIELDNINGINLPKYVKQLNPGVQIIFISAYIHYFEDVYSVDHVWFLSKPVSHEKFHKAINKAVMKSIENENKFVVVTNIQFSRSLPPAKNRHPGQFTFFIFYVQIGHAIGYVLFVQKQQKLVNYSANSLDSREFAFLMVIFISYRSVPYTCLLHLIVANFANIDSFKVHSTVILPLLASNILLIIVEGGLMLSIREHFLKPEHTQQD